jgi:hypothetical protein
VPWTTVRPSGAWISFSERVSARRWCPHSPDNQRPSVSSAPCRPTSAFGVVRAVGNGRSVAAGGMATSWRRRPSSPSTSEEGRTDVRRSTSELAARFPVGIQDPSAAAAQRHLPTAPAQRSPSRRCGPYTHQPWCAASQSCGLVSLPRDAAVQQQAQAIGVDHRRLACNCVVLAGHAPTFPTRRTPVVTHGQPRFVPMPSRDCGISPSGAVRGCFPSSR